MTAARDPPREGDLAQRLIGLAQLEMAGAKHVAGAVEDPARRLRTEPGEEHDELLAADPGHHMALAIVAQSMGDGLDHAVANGMAVCVVDPLEMIDVANPEAELGL